MLSYDTRVLMVELLLMMMLLLMVVVLLMVVLLLVVMGPTRWRGAFGALKLEATAAEGGSLGVQLL